MSTRILTLVRNKSSNSYETNGDRHDLDLLITLHSCVSCPLRKRVQRGKKYPSEARLHDLFRVIASNRFVRRDRCPNESNGEKTPSEKKISLRDTPLRLMSVSEEGVQYIWLAEINC